MSSSSNSNTGVGAEEIDGNFPLGRNLAVIEKGQKKGGNVRCQCNYCDKFIFDIYKSYIFYYYFFLPCPVSRTL